MRALPGTAWHDVMTYCDNQWLSSFTYDGIRTPPHRREHDRRRARRRPGGRERRTG